MTSYEAILGDLTRQQVDAVVNAANSTLLGGGGVDGALHAAAGAALVAACREVRRTTWPGGLPVGEAVATGAGDLPARWVIHTVGPNRHRGETDGSLLSSCYSRSLDVAVDVGARSIAFPAIGAGAYGWSPHDAARIAVRAVIEHPHPGVDLVRFVLFSEPLYEAFAAAVKAASPLQ